MMHMNTLAFDKNVLLPVVFACALTACDGTTLGHFDITEPLPKRTIVGGAGIPGPDILNQLLQPIPQDIKSTEEFKQEEFDYLNSVQLDALTLNISESSDEDSDFTQDDGIPDNFEFLGSLKVFIMADFDGASEKQLVGSVEESDSQLEGDSRSLSFTMTGVDILPYIEAPDGYRVKYEASGEVPPDDVTFDGEVRYRVGVGFK